jgi:glyceraldehyde-3-phosphate dehydrogenase/erythrose-4-phosphate dehydrogenase
MSTTVLIDGAGTIGIPITQFLLHPGIQKSFEIDEVIVRKFSPTMESIGMLYRFHKAGAKIAVSEERFDAFVKILKEAPEIFRPDYTYVEALEKASIVIDCVKDGNGLVNKEQFYKKHEERVKAFICQGSETDFGLPYARGHNDIALERYDGKYIWVLSCNVHSILAVINTVTEGYKNIDNIVKARFSLDRRAADVVNKKTITTPEIGKPTHKEYGTHQAEDAMKLLRTLGHDLLNIHAVADKEPQPFMHKMGVNLELKQPMQREKLIDLFKKNILTAITYYNHIGGPYIEGSNWGPTGRLIVQSVLVVDSVETPRPNELIFRCITPQDANPLLSSIAAMAQKLDPKHWNTKLIRHFDKTLKLLQVV